MISGEIISLMNEHDAGIDVYFVPLTEMKSGIIEVVVLFHDLTIHNNDIEKYFVPLPMMVSGELS